MHLPFEEVWLSDGEGPKTKVSPKAFLALPMPERIRHILKGTVEFVHDGETISTREALLALAREDLAFALSVVLLGLLMMVTRRNAVSQVIGFMSLENGLVLAATGAKGMPLVVEISVAFSVLIAFIVIGIFLFRIRERFDTVDLQALDKFRGERQ